MAKRNVHHNQTTNVATPSPRNPFSSLPRKFGRYILQEEIGAGGMGRVFKATHATLKQVVALKTIRDDRFEGDDQILRRFYREIEAAGAVIHPHVARATDAGEEQGIHFLITEYIDGIDLQALTQRMGGISAGVVCELAYQTSLGLEAIRSQGMIHRDIKPSNLLVTWDGQVKIVDLGLARILDASISSGQLTGSNALLGTLDFIAPEQAHCARDIDIRADLYSLGCTVIWLLTGQAVFGPPDYRFPAQKIRAHCDVEPNWNRLPPLEDGVLTVLKRLLAKRPGDRFETPAQVAEALKPYRDETALGPLLERVREEKNQELDSHAVTETVSYEYDTTVPRKDFAVWKWTTWFIGGVSFFVIALVATALLLNSLSGDRKTHLDEFREKAPDNSLVKSQAIDAVDTSQTRKLDELPPLEPHDLLERSPSERLWKGNAAGTLWQYDEKLNHLFVNADDVGMLELGTTSASNYIFSVTISQPRLSGGLGVYIGAHLNTYKGSEVLRYQCFQIQQIPRSKKKPSYRLTQYVGMEPLKPNPESPSMRAAIHSASFTPDPGDQLLEIHVDEGRLRKVLINNKPLDDFINIKIRTDETTDKNEDKELNGFRKLTPADFVGGLGVWADGATGAFKKAHYRHY